MIIMILDDPGNCQYLALNDHRDLSNQDSFKFSFQIIVVDPALSVSHQSPMITSTTVIVDILFFSQIYLLYILLTTMQWLWSNRVECHTMEEYWLIDDQMTALKRYKLMSQWQCELQWLQGGDDGCDGFEGWRWLRGGDMNHWCHIRPPPAPSLSRPTFFPVGH